MKDACRTEISLAARRRSNSASTTAGQPIQMSDEKVHGFCNRFSVRSQLLGGSYCLYPIHRGESDLSAVSLDLCIAIRCGGFRLPFRAKPKLDALPETCQ
jgi:hypothetical protein